MVLQKLVNFQRSRIAIDERKCPSVGGAENETEEDGSENLRDLWAQATGIKNKIEFFFFPR